MYRAANGRAVCHFSLTRRARSLPPEIIHAIEGANAQETADLLGAARLERQFDLERVRVRVAAVLDVPDRAGIASLCHKHLGGIVEWLVLEVAPWLAGVTSWWLDAMHNILRH